MAKRVRDFRNHLAPWAAVLILAALAAGLVTWRYWPATAPNGVVAPAPSPTVDDPRLSYATPFLNVKPDVTYVGDAVCAGCHTEIADTYAHHGMGRALAPVAAAEPSERYDAAAHNPLQVGGLSYHVAQEGARTVHRETLSDAAGTPLTQRLEEVHYVIGSGARGRSYLTEKDGFVFMSPMTWYPERKRWDLSPGFTMTNQHFNRPVIPECLFCHCSQVDPVPYAINRYRPPLFRGHVIGCERCHGPGDLHVRARERDERFDAIDPTIVNPKHLEPVLRDAICQQCHLQGQHRVTRRDRGPFDFRPGLPLHLFISVFTKPPEVNEDNKFVGQVEQMHASRCFTQSKGRLGCTSCHDPHALPKAEEKVAFYRQRCLQCHGDAGCSLPEAERKAKRGEDDCAGCHLPRGEANITHTSISDHRVLRNPSAYRGSGTGKLRPGQLPLVHFHKDLVGPDDPEVERDLAIALVELATKDAPDRQPVYARATLPLVEAAWRRHPDDVEILIARANAHWLLNELVQAADDFAEVLKRQPEREHVLDVAGNVAYALRRWDQARDYWRRAARLNPYRWRYRVGLAMVHAQCQEWHSAVFECQKALALDPTDPDARQVMALSQLRLGKTAEARRELDVLIALEPKEADRWRKWFAEQAKGQ
jgi:tetratricopeptide (TPR) repeat protein